LSDAVDTVVASVVISTFNRSEALPPTLTALADQDLPPDRYEVIVVDDGSADDTQAVLAGIEMPYRLNRLRHDVNRGVSAGRNTGMREAKGRFLILLSDDLVVSENFIGEHVRTLERFPGRWVVGGFSQLDDLMATPFGRYLDGLERSFEAARVAEELEPGIREMPMPTARNLSLPRADLERIGYFDEQFRVTCEDQDLAERARAVGIGFLYNDGIRCIHNDRAADLRRYCRFQERGAADTVRLVRKRPDLHGNALVIKVNGPISRADPPGLVLKKLVKSASSPPVDDALMALIRLAERTRLPDALLFRAYSAMIGIATFRGWREGLRE
jgi:GT2 family glycosyltransferase